MDRFWGNKRELFGSRVIDTKISALDTGGGLCVTEIIDVEKADRPGTCTTSKKSGEAKF